MREVATLLDLDPGNLSKELRKLAKEGLFLAESKGKIKFYRLNPYFPLYQELKQMIFKTEGLEGSLRELVNQFPKIKLAFIYGSYAKGEEKATSDIDLVIMGNPDRDLLTDRIRELELRLRREINFNLYSSAEFGTKTKEKGSFLSEIAADKKIMLKGSLINE